MPNDMINPVDLEPFPGSPFDDAAVDAAVATVRAVAGWHISPSRVQTVSVDTHGSTYLYLPTRYLTAVSAVRNMTGTTPVVITGFRTSKSGKLSRASGWPCGFSAVEADITHGYATCPRELLPILAGLCQSSATAPNVSQESVGPFSRSYRSDSDRTGAAVAAIPGLSLAWGAA